MIIIARHLLCLLLILPIAFLSACSNNNTNLKGEVYEISESAGNYVSELVSKYEIPEGVINQTALIPDDTSEIISDAESAAKVAEEAMISTFGKSVDSKKPLKAKYDSKYDIWLVSGTLSQNQVGGVPYAIIIKSSGKILAIWHTK